MWIRTRTGPIINVDTGAVIKHVTTHEGGIRVVVKNGDHETDITFLPNDNVMLKRLADAYNVIWKSLEKEPGSLDFSAFGQPTPRRTG